METNVLSEQIAVSIKKENIVQGILFIQLYFCKKNMNFSITDIIFNTKQSGFVVTQKNLLQRLRLTKVHFNLFNNFIKHWLIVFNKGNTITGFYVFLIRRVMKQN